MTNSDLCFSSVMEILAMVKEKAISPVELTDLYLARIEKFNPLLNAYLTTTGEEARNQAIAAESSLMRGDNLGPLHGVPISIKDLDMTKGVLTTLGSRIYKNNIPDVDSIHVEQLRRAGAIMLGKTNTPEFGLLGRTENDLGEPCRNPWNAKLTAGGSSGGSAAAVSAGLCALGTAGDGGGSIRIPASFCGVYGIKPTLGRVPFSPTVGRSPVGTNNLVQLGSVTRTVADSALVLQIMSGYDPRDPSSSRRDPPDFLSALNKDIKGLRVAWSPNYGYSEVEREVNDITYDAALSFEDLGCEVSESKLSLNSPFEPFWTIFCADEYLLFKGLLENHPDQLTSYAKECFEIGATVTGAEYASALGQIDLIKAQFMDVFEDFDLLLSPTMPVTPFPHGKPPDKINGQPVHWFGGSLPFTYPINLTGNPAASLPSGFSKEGLPVGLQIVGRWWDEETVLAASAAFEISRPWIHHKPPIS